MTFLPGTSIPDVEDRANALQEMAETLRGIHAVPLNAEFSGLVRIDSASHYIKRITGIWAAQLAEARHDPLAGELQRLLDRWRDSRDAGILTEPAPRIFARRDSSLVNWLWDGTTSRCVDFEFAGWSDLAFECADLVEHISARAIDDAVWDQIVTGLGVHDGPVRLRFAAARRTCALRWLAVLWKQREQRREEFQVQLDRVHKLHRDAGAAL